jgi:hypothetical protein
VWGKMRETSLGKGLLKEQSNKRKGMVVKNAEE